MSSALNLPAKKDLTRWQRKRAREAQEDARRKSTGVLKARKVYFRHEHKARAVRAAFERKQAREAEKVREHKAKLAELERRKQERIAESKREDAERLRDLEQGLKSESASEKVAEIVQHRASVKSAEERGLVMVDQDKFHAALDKAADEARDALDSMTEAEMPEIPDLVGSWDQEAEEDPPNAIYMHPKLYAWRANFWVPTVEILPDDEDFLWFEDGYFEGPFKETFEAAWSEWIDQVFASPEVDLDGIASIMDAVRPLQGKTGWERDIWKPGRCDREKLFRAVDEASNLAQDKWNAARALIPPMPLLLIHLEFAGETTRPLDGNDYSLFYYQPTTALPDYDGLEGAIRLWNEFRDAAGVAASALRAAREDMEKAQSPLRDIHSMVHLFRRGSQFSFRGE